MDCQDKQGPECEQGPAQDATDPLQRQLAEMDRVCSMMEEMLDLQVSVYFGNCCPICVCATV